MSAVQRSGCLLIAQKKLHRSAVVLCVFFVVVCVVVVVVVFGGCNCKTKTNVVHLLFQDSKPVFLLGFFKM